MSGRLCGIQSEWVNHRDLDPGCVSGGKVQLCMGSKVRVVGCGVGYRVSENKQWVWDLESINDEWWQRV